MTDENGEKYAPFAEDEAAVVWEWFKKLYDEGLMDPAAFVDKTKDMRDKMGASSQKTAVTADWVAWVGLHNSNAEAAGIPAEEYEIVSLPGLQTPDGDYMLGKGSASLFAVPPMQKIRTGQSRFWSILLHRKAEISCQQVWKDMIIQEKKAAMN